MIQFTLRLEDDQHERIQKAAEQDRRSMNSEIVWLLDSALDQRDINRTPPRRTDERD